MIAAATGVPAVDAILVWSAAAAAAAGLATLVWRTVRGAARFTRRAGEFLDDWRGEDARPGVPARPGVMERLENIEQDLGDVRHEVFPNAGQSLRDRVDAIDRRTAWIEAAEGDPPTTP